ncbi:hypothetical protein RBQ61_15535 [Sedimentibacter sp. MB35-C1]|nr:hypothetical protein [Sedimentibacter sp. MB35-C1]WMJ76967.1 hypothetical protein RBQ61_15535 [Sedimentibacter sp. MB35-C1]
MAGQELSKSDEKVIDVQQDRPTGTVLFVINECLKIIEKNYQFDIITK